MAARALCRGSARIRRSHRAGRRYKRTGPDPAEADGTRECRISIKVPSSGTSAWSIRTIAARLTSRPGSRRWNLTDLRSNSPRAGVTAGSSRPSSVVPWRCGESSRTFSRVAHTGRWRYQDRWPNMWSRSRVHTAARIASLLCHGFARECQPLSCPMNAATGPAASASGWRGTMLEAPNDIAGRTLSDCFTGTPVEFARPGAGRDVSATSLGSAGDVD